ncbi:MAG: S8 family serine peptidase [Methanotrichaceae archaeon]|nr:S8 family serine peptidase [Methanotrichaceae archaeon]
MTNQNSNYIGKNEDKATYYYNAAEKRRIPLVREPRVFAVRYRTGRSSRDSGFSPRSIRLLREESKNIGFIPNYGLQIYQANPEAISLRTEPEAQLNNILYNVKKLNSEEPVEYASIAYRRNPDTPAARVDDLMFVTREFVVQFEPETTREQIDVFNAKYDVSIVKELDYAVNGYLLEAPEAEGEHGPVALSNIYYESGKTIFAHPNFIKRRHLRETRCEPKFVLTSQRERADQPIYLPQQWHLKTANVIDAWNITRGDRSIKIAILDDGVDVGHQEFAGKIVAQKDFASGNDDGSPNSSNDNHGTACAGVALAKGVRALGAAPGCSLIAVRYPDFLGSADEADMFRWAKDHDSDVISCSWGPEDGTGAVDPLPDNVRAAINYCATQGRSGRGIPIFWAAGNGNESVSNDGYASNPDVMAIAASSNNDRRSPYSDFGTEIFICAPSSGNGALGEKRIFTVDRRGNNGYNPDPSTGVSHPANDHDYTDDFGGTSSATPLVAGIAGLMLSVNRNLKVQDIRQILKDTADKIDQSGGNYVNGHSNLYGYGRINSLRAVERARDFVGGGTSGTAPGKPSINGPASINRSDQPPTFQINKGGRSLYAVEVAIRADLFNGNAHGGERNASNFYASWAVEGLMSNVPYNLPSDVWSRLKGADRIFYRLHVADDNSWSNYDGTVSDDQAGSAPSIQILAASGTGTTSPARPSINGPASINRSDQPPTFQINKGGRSLYAVEVAIRADLFNGNAHGGERNASNFYASWAVEGLMSNVPYNLPSDVWSRLKGADRIFYRLHVADDNSWSNYDGTVSDDQARNAPSIQIFGGAATMQRSVTFPSGATFNVVDAPEDNIDYSDPVGNGAVPLIEVHGRLQENLSRNFKVNELVASDGSRYARISPELVEGLQKIRDRAGSAIIVNSGYRHPALNEAVGGADNSQHIAGRAADIRTSTKRPLEMARIVLEELGCEIGLGLGKNSIHVDLRGQLASWRYEGSEMNEDEFDKWVRDTCRQIGQRNVTKKEYAERVVPIIIGPESYEASNDAPSFYIQPGPNPYFAVEIATYTDLLNRQFEAERKPSNFYGSWMEEGLIEVHGTTMYTLPRKAWELLRNNERLFYRIVTSATFTPQWSNVLYSISDLQAADAPWIEITGRGQKKEELAAIPQLNLRAARKTDENLWRF